MSNNTILDLAAIKKAADKLVDVICDDKDISARQACAARDLAKNILILCQQVANGNFNKKEQQ